MSYIPKLETLWYCTRRVVREVRSERSFQVIANINPDTGIAYGFIDANVLHPDIVNELQQGTDVYYAQALEEAQREAARDFEVQAEMVDSGEITETQWERADEDERFSATLKFVKDNWAGSRREQEFNDAYCPDEPVHEGEKDGVKYRTSWLGGALNVWIFESPFVTEKAGRASPCVPNAGILDDLTGDVRAYNVPDNWREQPDELHDADPNCVHVITAAPGGGIKCTKCNGWFCF